MTEKERARTDPDIYIISFSNGQYLGPYNSVAVQAVLAQQSMTKVVVPGCPGRDDEMLRTMQAEVT